MPSDRVRILSMPPQKGSGGPQPAEASPQPLADAAARAQALDAEASWIVEAPAGSGKTGLLVQRYLRLLALESTAEPENVLAITFTKKATAELRERVVGTLRGAADGNAAGVACRSAFDQSTRTLARAVLERDAAQGWKLLQQPQRLRIRTIDALNAEIARALPLLSGAGAGAGLRVQPEAGLLYREAARRTLLQLGGADAALDAALRALLLLREGSLADCETLLAEMLPEREQWAGLVPLDRPLGWSLDDAVLDGEVRPRLEAALVHVVCAALARARRLMPADALAALAWTAEKLSRHPGRDGKASPIAVCGGKALPGAGVDDLEHWQALAHLCVTGKGTWRQKSTHKGHLGFEVDKAELSGLQAVLDELRDNDALCAALAAVAALPPARYPETQWAAAKAIFRALRHALVELKLYFAESGECDFTEVALAARTALDDNAGVGDLGSATGAALQHLLVDEMQDTSAGQYALIEQLTAGWDGSSQTVFLVGDPKQSIYMFRQARVERFLRTLAERRLGDVPLGVLRLSANFRSQARLVEEGFNVDFARIFPEPGGVAARGHAGTGAGDDVALDVPFVEAQAALPATTAAGRVWHAAILERADSDRNSETQSEMSPALRHAQGEADEIARIAASWRERPLPGNRRRDADGHPLPWSVAVLARTREHLALTIEAFRAATPPIPYRQVEIEKLGERAEVLDAMALTRALSHPGDRLAWLAVLHAPWCGLGLRDLLAVAGGGEDASRHETVLFTAAARRGLLTPTGQQLFDRAWPVLEAAWAARGRTSLATLVERTWKSLGGDAALTPEEQANVQVYLEVLRAVEEPGSALALDELERRVGKLYARPAACKGFVVDLLTMHKAKGLEWDVVLLPGLERKAQSDMAGLLNWVELDAAETRAKDAAGPSESGAATMVLAPIHGRADDASKLYEWICSVRAQRNKAERKRLLYVAATRAREELHLFGAVVRPSKGGLRPQAGSLLETAWPAAEAVFWAADEAAAAAEASGARGPQLVHAQQRAGSGEAGGGRNEKADEADYDTLALAAAAGEGEAAGAVPSAVRKPPMLHRLPLGYNALATLEKARRSRLQYTAAEDLRSAAQFARPQGSYAVRAFGNVLHRFLEQLAQRLSTVDTQHADEAAAALAVEASSWAPRLHSALRAEGLAPAGLEKLAERAVAGLSRALADPTGRWVMGPHAAAASEAEVRAGGSVLRVDRSFVAGDAAGSTGDTHLWLVDFKTAEQGGLSDAQFAARERAVYTAQMEAYAAAFASAGETRPIMLGLYYPLAAQWLAWRAGPASR